VAVIPLPVVFAREQCAELLRRVLPERTVFVKSRRELFGAMFSRGAIAFVEYELLDLIDGANLDRPVVAVLEPVAANVAAAAAVTALETYPWLSHVVHTPLLSMERGRAHFDTLIERAISTHDTCTIANNAIGRTAMLASASKRASRFDRMREYLQEQNVSERLITTLLDVGEELVMNALYNAPFEAGFFGSAPRSRADDVELPPDRACEISYGVDDSTVFLRVRDTFGALKRSRLVEVLSRCASEGVVLDESRGGAGLGMWRIFTSASAVSITVVPGVVTEITVVIGKKDSRRIARPLAIDLYFEKQRRENTYAGDEPFLLDRSITFAIRGGSITPTPTPQS
jgi:hypothetical protein